MRLHKADHCAKLPRIIMRQEPEAHVRIERNHPLRRVLPLASAAATAIEALISSTEKARLGFGPKGFIFASSSSPPLRARSITLPSSIS